LCGGMGTGGGFCTGSRPLCLFISNISGGGKSVHECVWSVCKRICGVCTYLCFWFVRICLYIFCMYTALTARACVCVCVHVFVCVYVREKEYVRVFSYTCVYICVFIYMQWVWGTEILLVKYVYIPNTHCIQCIHCWNTSHAAINVVKHTQIACTHTHTNARVYITEIHFMLQWMYINTHKLHVHTHTQIACTQTHTNARVYFAKRHRVLEWMYIHTQIACTQTHTHARIYIAEIHLMLQCIRTCACMHACMYVCMHE